MKLTQEMIDEIQRLMEHTKKDGSLNWVEGEEIEINLAGTFAADRFIVIKNASKKPWVKAEPHPYFDYEKKVFTKDGREEYMKEQKKMHICFQLLYNVNSNNKIVLFADN